MKQTRLTILIFAQSLLCANAQSVLSHDPSNSGTGSYNGQSFNLTDPAFVTAGDTLGSFFSLQSIEIAKWSTSGYGTEQEAVYLNIYQGSTYLGSSNNSINWKNNVTGLLDGLDVYNFSGVTALQNLDISQQYTFRFSTTPSDGNFITVRPGISSSELLVGNMINTSGSDVDTGFDMRFKLTVAQPIPEPASGALFVLASGMFLLRRRRVKTCY